MNKKENCWILREIKRVLREKKRAEVLIEGWYNRRELHYEKEVCILREEAEIVLNNIVMKQKNTKPYCNQIKRGWAVGSALICFAEDSLNFNPWHLRLSPNLTRSDLWAQDQEWTLSPTECGQKPKYICTNKI